MAENYEYKKNWFSPKYLLAYLVFAVVVYGLIYYFFLGGKRNTTQYVNYNPAPSVAKNWRIDLTAQNNSGLVGSALLTAVGGGTKVVLSFPNSNSTVAMPAHIHAGACPNPGAIKYPLAAVVGGRSETTVAVSINDLKKQLPLAVNVHKSVVEPGTYVSCGDLK